MIRVFSQYISPKNVALVGFEWVVSTLALLIGIKLRFWSSPGDFSVYTSIPKFSAQAGLFLVVLHLCLYYGQFYDLYAVRRRFDQLTCLGQSIGAACVVLAVIYYAVPDLLIGRGAFLTSMIAVGVCLMLTRIVLDAAWQMAGPVHNVLILGAGGLATKVAREFDRREDLNLCLTGMLAPPAQSDRCGTECAQVPVLGITTEIVRIVREKRISKIVIALEDRRGALPIRDLVRLRVEGVHVEDAHTAMSALTEEFGWMRFSPAGLSFRMDFDALQ